MSMILEVIDDAPSVQIPPPRSPSEGHLPPLNRTIQGDAATVLATLPDGCVHCCVTSPPYWGLRDYGVDGQIGLERSLGAYLNRLLAVMAEVRRVLRDDGTLWLNVGDAYSRPEAKGVGGPSSKQDSNAATRDDMRTGRRLALSPKNLIGLPWRIAFALQEVGWILRSDIIWTKPNPMPESVRDRPTRAHEYVFLLSKAGRYYYNADAVRTPFTDSSVRRLTQANLMNQSGGPKDYGQDSNRSHRRALDNQRKKMNGYTERDGGYRKNGMRDDGRLTGHRHAGFEAWDARSRHDQVCGGANLRDTWDIATQSFREAHFATFPEALVERCLLAGTSVRCCSICGAPWQPVSRSQFVRQQDVSEARAVREASGSKEQPGGWGGFERGTTVHVADGSRPACECDAESVPAIVLDPFHGSGTVGLVARKMDRDFIGVELNPEYVRMANDRIANDGRAGTLSLPL